MLGVTQYDPALDHGDDNALGRLCSRPKLPRLAPVSVVSEAGSEPWRTSSRAHSDGGNTCVKRSILLVAGALVLVASLVIGPAASAKSEATSAGTVVFGHDQEPSTLNPFVTEGSNTPTPLTMNNVLASGAIYNNKAALIPQLWDGQPKILKNDPLTVTWKYKQSAVWSDGQPVTGQDFFDTYKVIMNPNFDITDRTGWEDIQSVKAKGKSVTMTFKKGKPVAFWDAIAGNQLMPRQQVGPIMNSQNAADFNNMWLNSMPLSSGPFKFQSWTKGTQLTIVKNPKWKAGPAAKLDKIVFRFIPSTPSEFQALQAGEIQAMSPQPQIQIADLYKNSKFKVQTTPAFQWQHVDIQRGPKGSPALDQKYVRQALVLGINRQQIVNALWVSTGLVQSAKDLPVLQNNVFFPQQAQYKPYWSQYKFSQKAVIALLKQHGCTGGPNTPSASNSSIWSCPRRRQAQLPLHDDERQSAPRARLRGHAEAAQERGHRARAELRPEHPRLRTDPPVR